jgi:membrane protein EpsK
LSNILYFAVNIIFGLALVPFFLDTLGTAAYGLIPLATSITSYITLVIDVLNVSILRFLTIDLQRADVEKANQTFNTALFGTLGVILLAIPFALIVAWYAPAFFNIGDQSAIDVFLLFALVFGSVLIRAWSGIFMVILFAYNRLDLRNYVNIMNIVMQLILIVILFLWFGPSLALVGLSYLIAAMVSFALAFVFSISIGANLKIMPSLFDKSRLKEIGGLSIWVLLEFVSSLLISQIALLLVNRLFGAVAGTEYSLAIIWSTVLISIGSMVTNLFTPMIYSYYSKNDREGLVIFSTSTTKIIGLAMALPISLACIFAPQLLTIWVGAKYSHIAPLIWICIVPVILQTMASCVSPIIIAYDRIKSLVILILPLSFLNIALALLLPYLFDIGLYGVALAGFITLVIRYGVVTPLFLAKVVKMPIFTYLHKMMYGVGGMAILSIVGIATFSIISVTMFPLIILSCCGLAVAYLLFVVRFILIPEERSMIRSCLPEYFQKILPSWLL